MKTLIKLLIFIFITVNINAAVFSSSDSTANTINISAKELQMKDLKNKIKHYSDTINVKFTQTDVRSILKFFSSEFRVNIITAQEVKGKITFSFENVNPIDAFNSILVSNGYDWYFEHNIIQVFSQKPIKVFKLNYATCTEIAESIKPLISKDSTLSTDLRLNSIIIKGSEVDIKKITRVIEELDAVPQQVLVEVQIMEVQEGYSRGLGLDFAYSKDNGGSYAETQSFSKDSTNPEAGLFVKVLKGDVSAIAQALETNSNLNILARPKVLALNHKKANLVTGQRLGYKTSQTSATTGFISEAVDFLEVGTTLSFTPHISDNGDILMEIRPEVSEGNINNGIPNETTTQTDTTVLVKDGQTILIGGLIRNKESSSQSGIPILGSLPILDNIFSRTDISTQKVETIVLITPHLVTNKTIHKLK
jgi:type IV pilus assembly protein PilQ